jgi:hypothetical protein
MTLTESCGICLWCKNTRYQCINLGKPVADLSIATGPTGRPGITLRGKMALAFMQSKLDPTRVIRYIIGWPDFKALTREITLYLKYGENEYELRYTVRLDEDWGTTT